MKVFHRKISARICTRQLRWRVNWNMSGIKPCQRVLRYGFEGYGRKGMQSKPFPVSQAPVFVLQSKGRPSQNDVVDVLAQLRVVPVIKLSPSRKGSKFHNIAR